jgi:hypothetical protein
LLKSGAVLEAAADTLEDGVLWYVKHGLSSYFVFRSVFCGSFSSCPPTVPDRAWRSPRVFGQTGVSSAALGNPQAAGMAGRRFKASDVSSSRAILRTGSLHVESFLQKNQENFFHKLSLK